MPGQRLRTVLVYNYERLASHCSTRCSQLSSNAACTSGPAPDPLQALPSVCSAFRCAAGHIILLPSFGHAKQAADIHQAIATLEEAEQLASLPVDWCMW